MPSEWWTYELADLLMFAPRTYYRLFELYNEATWPAVLLGGATGIVLALAALGLSRPDAHRAALWMFVLLSASWLWVGLVFHARHYATILPAARWWAALGVLEALLMLLAAAYLFTRSSTASPPTLGGRATGWVVLLVGLLVEPVMGPLFGRGWRGVEVFGVAPDPTALVTVGAFVLLPMAPTLRVALLTIPLAWCLFSGATLAAMNAPDHAIVWITPMAGFLGWLTVTFVARARARRGRTTGQTGRWSGTAAPPR